MRAFPAALAATVVLLLTGAGTAHAASPAGALRAGAGQADITPPRTGYYLGGWTRADRLALGQSTRLYANALVLQRGTRKLALVAAEVFAIPAGLQEDVARKVADLGYDRTSVVLAASHTHSGPGGFANNPLYNSAAPSPETIGDPSSFVNFFLTPPPADRQLYTFVVNQIAAAIRRADADRSRAAAAWGHTDLTNVTQNRSLFAFLRNYGIRVEDGQATPEMDPKGALDTIDTNVDVLRVDKLVRRRGRTVRVPIGAYSNFADHGTVVHSESQVYSGDHHAAAWRVFAAKVRRAGRVPAGQTVVNVYPNGAEGDMTAGIANVGIAAARRVGTAEANAMYAAWKRAGRRLSRTPALDWRWTRTCFCGRQTATGPVDSAGKEGLPFLTGSDEGRGPLFDLTHVSFEGLTTPAEDPVQGNKVIVPVGDPPPAVPVGVYRVGDGVIATIPGEPTKQVGVGVRDAVLGALRGTGVTHALIGGLAFDYIQYITTPAEYGAQSYEGGSTLFGRNSATFLQERLAELGAAMKDGKAAPAPYPLDVSYGVKPDGPAFGAGAPSGTITAQPAATVARGGTVRLAWTGGGRGADRPVDRAFIVAERRSAGRWRTVDTDLGLDMLWRVDDAGHYTLTWDVPASAKAGTYRLRVTASRYGLVSGTFRVG
jgi:hypothetical protein